MISTAWSDQSEDSHWVHLPKIKFTTTIMTLRKWQLPEWSVLRWISRRPGIEVHSMLGSDIANPRDGIASQKKMSGGRIKGNVNFPFRWSSFCCCNTVHMRSIPLNRQRVTQEAPGDKDPSSSYDHLWVPKHRTVAWALSNDYDTNKVQSIDLLNKT